jgi:hypothetical protein
MSKTATTLPELSQRPNTLFDLLAPALASPGQPGAILESPEQQTPPPDLAGSYWLAFTGDHDKGDVERCFQRRYGQPPRYHPFDGLGGLLLVGPVPGQEGGA